MTPGNQTRNTSLVASKNGARVFRANVGLAWVGSTILKPTVAMTTTLSPGDVVVRNARPFKAGVPGMSDSIGFKSVVITPAMVGQTVAQFVALEDKQGTGRTSDEQKGFIGAVRRAGGLAGVTRSDADTVAILAGEIRD